jgi:hypothetical protein
MSKPKVVASGLLVAVFAMGVVVGNTGRLLADRGEEKSDQPEPPRSYVQWLEEDMILNTQQETAISVILEQYNNDMHDLWSYVRPRSSELRSGARSAIANILSEEQQIAYEQKNQELDSLRAEKRRTHDQK